MSARAIVWLVVAIALVAVLVLAGLQAGRAARDLKRAKARLDAFEELPVVGALTTGQADVRRLQLAASRIAPLAARSEVALATIRRGPVPPELLPALGRVRAELEALSRLRLF